MKKLVLLSFILISITVQAQKPSIWRPIPDFKEGDRALQGQFLWRLSAVVTANELTWDKANHQFISAPLSSVGPAIGYKHIVPLDDGTPYIDWGVSAALLLGTDLNNPTSVKAAVLLNAFNYINVGACYTFNQVNHFGILLGTSVNF